MAHPRAFAALARRIRECPTDRSAARPVWVGKTEGPAERARATRPRAPLGSAREKPRTSGGLAVLGGRRPRRMPRGLSARGPPEIPPFLTIPWASLRRTEAAWNAPPLPADGRQRPVDRAPACRRPGSLFSFAPAVEMPAASPPPSGRSPPRALPRGGRWAAQALSVLLYEKPFFGLFRPGSTPTRWAVLPLFQLAVPAFARPSPVSLPLRSALRGSSRTAGLRGVAASRSKRRAPSRPTA